jgi:hypothetical protein
MAKYKKGDEVSLLKDLSNKMVVVDVKTEKVNVPESRSYSLWTIVGETIPAHTEIVDYVELDNHKIYKAEELTIYSPALAYLQREIKDLKDDLHRASKSLKQDDNKDSCDCDEDDDD